MDTKPSTAPASLLRTARRHSCYKYSGEWYGSCGVCTATVIGTRWEGAFYLLGQHVVTHVTVSHS